VSPNLTPAARVCNCSSSTLWIWCRCAAHTSSSMIQASCFTFTSVKKMPDMAGRFSNMPAISISWHSCSASALYAHFLSTVKHASGKLPCNRNSSCQQQHSNEIHQLFCSSATYASFFAYCCFELVIVLIMILNLTRGTHIQQKRYHHLAHQAVDVCCNCRTYIADSSLMHMIQQRCTRQATDIFDKKCKSCSLWEWLPHLQHLA